MASTPEAKMKKKVDAVLREMGVWFFAPQSGIYGRSGIPDRIGILPGGRILAVEVKASKRYGLTALQDKTLAEIRTAGGSTWVVDDEQSLAALAAAIRIGAV
jgi:hypothetical protein